MCLRSTKARLNNYSSTMPTCDQHKLVSIITAQLCLHRRMILLCLRSNKASLNNYRSTMPTSENDTNVFAISKRSSQ